MKHARRLAYGVGAVGVRVLDLSVAHCTESIGLLTGSHRLLAVGFTAFPRAIPLPDPFVHPAFTLANIGSAAGTLKPRRGLPFFDDPGTCPILARFQLPDPTVLPVAVNVLVPTASDAKRIVGTKKFPSPGTVVLLH
jgi:hypothetical protein